MALLSTSSHLIKISQDYSAGENISIVGNVINSKDWTDDISNASANAYNAATAQVDNKLDTTAFTNWQDGQYNTDLQTIESQIANKLDVSSFSDVSASFLTAINIPESATWYEVSQAYEQASGTYLTAHQSLDGYATEQWVEDKGYLTDVSIPESANWNDTSEVVKTNSGTWNTVTNKLDTTAFSTVSGDFLTAHQDLSNYYTKDETSGKEQLAQAFANIPAGDTEVNSYVHNNSASIDGTSTVVQSNSSTWNDVTAYQSNSASYAITGNIGSNQYGQITGYNSSAIFATASKQAQCDVFNRTITSTYYTTANANTLSSMLSGAIDYVSANAGDEFPTSADEAIQYVQTNSANIDDTVTSYQTNSGTFLTAHQAISAEEWNSNYETVNTNSGVWGGSALPISAGPGIKVNLVDNTLVFSNDETVLWEGSANAGLFPITLSEPATAFEEIKFIWTPRYQGDYGCPTVVEVQNTNPHAGTIKYTLMHAYWNANEPWIGAWYLTPTDNYTKIASEKNAFCNMMKSQTAMSDGLNCFLWKVIGIGRKEV